MKPYELKIDDGTLYGRIVCLNEEEMSRIHEYYEVQCTAEYISEKYIYLTEEEAEAVAKEARRKMDHYGYNEDEAVESVINEMDFERMDD